ncbi:MAG: hypothetical protein HND58_15455 [Planctomycetota bacterium]|nr:MAG: hypothetical protein HND58_15455 [Planctomycetota bacterium]
MSRINSNIPSLIAQANLSRNNSELQLRLERLSTGLRINRGADDPAGLIITERIRSDLNGIEQAMRNVERASAVIATTESGLAEVGDLLTSIRALMVESANTGANSEEERAANQLQIDSAIDSITRISNTATFGGLKLLNGSLDYTLSGVDTSEISRAKVNNASLINVDSLEVEVDVLASAQTGGLYYNGGTTPPRRPALLHHPRDRGARRRRGPHLPVRGQPRQRRRGRQQALRDHRCRGLAGQRRRQLRHRLQLGRVRVLLLRLRPSPRRARPRRRRLADAPVRRRRRVPGHLRRLPVGQPHRCHSGQGTRRLGPDQRQPRHRQGTQRLGQLPVARRRAAPGRVLRHRPDRDQQHLQRHRRRCALPARSGYHRPATAERRHRVGRGLHARGRPRRGHPPLPQLDQVRRGQLHRGECPARRLHTGQRRRPVRHRRHHHPPRKARLDRTQRPADQYPVAPGLLREPDGEQLGDPGLRLRPRDQQAHPGPDPRELRHHRPAAGQPAIPAGAPAPRLAASRPTSPQTTHPRALARGFFMRHSTYMSANSKTFGALAAPLAQPAFPARRWLRSSRGKIPAHKGPGRIRDLRDRSHTRERARKRIGTPGLGDGTGHPIQGTEDSMSRINTNVQSMVAQRVLGQNNQMLNRSLERLSTGLRINRGKDDPSGLIASENLRAEITATNSAISNATRADQVVNTAEGGLQEISSMLTELQGLVNTSSSTGGLSQEERDANQLQIDSILQTIDRIAGATSFQGMKLLNGNFDYQVSSIDSSVSDFKVNGAKFNGTSQDIDVIVTQSAQQGILFLSFGGTSLDLNSADSGNFTIEITGANGSRELQFASGTALSDMVTAINTFSDITGITASVASSGATTGIALVSSDFGDDEFSTVKVINEAGMQGSDTNIGIYTMEADDAGTIETTVDALFDSTNAANGIRDSGQDIGAIINGIAATTKGKDISINTDFLDVEMTLSTSASQTLAQIDAFKITGGGADFQLAPTVDIGGQVSLGIGDVAARKLGSSVNGFLDDLASGKSYNVSDSDGTQAQKIVTEAISQVSSLRGRLGAFQKNVIGATIRSLGIAVENTAAAESVIRDADFASETAALTRSQILSQASTNVLSIANNQPQAALQLLG